jgi:tetratricopeptide (TPR) repeat protein
MKRTAWVGALLLAASCEPARTLRNEPLLAKADDFFLRERYAEAAGHYEAFLSENPEYARRADVLTRVGKCHLGAGAPDRAAAALDRALAAQPPASVKVDATFRLGIARRMLGDVPKALEAFRATAAAPIGDRDVAGITSDELAYETAQAQFRAGDWNAGQAELVKVGANGPFGARARTRLGLKGYVVQIGAYADEAQARSAAGKVGEASVRLTPGTPPLHVVSVGPYARYENALAEAERLKAAGFRDAFVLP